MKKDTSDLIIKFGDVAAKNSYVAMMLLNENLKRKRKALGGQFEEMYTKGLVEITEKEFYAALQNSFNKIDELNLVLTDEDYTFLRTTFDQLSIDMVALIRRVYHHGKYITEMETTKLRFQVCGENLHINLHEKISDYKSTKNNKLLSLGDKLGYFGAAFAVVSLIIAFIMYLNQI